MLQPEAVGQWHGNLFVFDEPWRMPDGQECRQIIVDDESLPEGLTRDDAIHAFINGVPFPDEDEGE